METGKKAKWEFYSPDEEKVRTFANDLNISSYLSKILINRNIKSESDARDFLFPLLETLPSPEVIPNIKKAADFVYDGILNKKKFLVYGDYDVDGVTGTAVLVDTLRLLNATVEYYIPHRYSEGYGLNLKAIELIAEKGVNIIITVDCGVSNNKEIKLAREIGIDVIVIDHHTPPPQLPQAVAIVNPKLSYGGSPYYNLAGVGVAYKFIEMLYLTAGINLNQIPEYFLELVALGTISDIVPLLKENRTLTMFGLQRLNQTKNIGINNLKKITSLKKAIDTYSVGFILGPRLNAAGRMAHASISVNLLLSASEPEALDLAGQLHSINELRKTSGRLIKDTIIEQLTTHYDLNNEKCIIMDGENWNPGIIGIVASQIASQFCRPTVLIATNQGKGRGSVRSTANIDIFTPLSKCRHLFNEFGGHTEAAGFEINSEKIPEFKELFKSICNDEVAIEDLQRVIKIDIELTPDELTLKLAKELAKLEPFGQANPEPVFFTKNLYPIDFKIVGDGSHLLVTFSDGINMIQAIGFGMADQLDKLKKDGVEIVYHLKINDWKNKPSIQLQLLNIRNN